MTNLKDAAHQVRTNAYAPYSGFKVGAALKSEKGNIFVGVNVENAAYPEGTCAEAGAIAALIAAGDKFIVEVYVVADCPLPVPPCGGCRQKRTSRPSAAHLTMSGVMLSLDVSRGEAYRAA